MKEPIKYILTGDACSGPHLARKINEVIEHVNRLEKKVEFLTEETASEIRRLGTDMDQVAVTLRSEM